MCRWFFVLLAACGAPRAREPAAITPAAGVAIAIYSNGARSYGVVDDRREIEVAGDTMFLDRIDPASALQSLVIEPLGADPIRVLACARERVDDSAAALAQLAEARSERRRRIIVVRESSPQRFRFEDDPNAVEPAIVPPAGVLSPIVRCRVRARPGKYLVRVLQVTSAFAFRAQHDVDMTDAEHARVTTRFAIETPTWQAARASVTLFDGLPGDEDPPTELVRAPVILDGSTAIIATGPRELDARLRAIYDGAKRDDTDLKPSDIAWGRESRRQVWVWLELPAAARLAPGPLRARIELPDGRLRELEISAELRTETDDHARYPMWIDEDLLGSRRRTTQRADGVIITDRVSLTVANLGAKPREVWVEERLRTAKRRSLAHAWPTRPTLEQGVVRTKLTLAPGQTERLGFTIEYEL